MKFTSIAVVLLLGVAGVVNAQNTTSEASVQKLLSLGLTYGDIDYLEGVPDLDLSILVEAGNTLTPEERDSMLEEIRELTPEERDTMLEEIRDITKPGNRRLSKMPREILIDSEFITRLREYLRATASLFATSSDV